MIRMDYSDLNSLSSYTPQPCSCKVQGRVVGATGFEPATPCTPCKCATRLRHAPTVGRSLTGKGSERSAAQELQDVLELGADLTDDLLALARVRARFVA